MTAHPCRRRTEPVVEGLRGAGLGGASTAARHRCAAARGAPRRPTLQLLPSQRSRAALLDEPASEGRQTAAHSVRHEESAATTAMTGLQVRPLCRSSVACVAKDAARDVSVAGQRQWIAAWMPQQFLTEALELVLGCEVWTLRFCMGAALDNDGDQGSVQTSCAGRGLPSAAEELPAKSGTRLFFSSAIAAPPPRAAVRFPQIIRRRLRWIFQQIACGRTACCLLLAFARQSAC